MYYGPDADADLDDWNLVPVPSANRSTVISTDDLDPESEYFTVVRASTVDGDGPSSTPISFLTGKRSKHKRGGSDFWNSIVQMFSFITSRVIDFLEPKVGVLDLG